MFLFMIPISAWCIGGTGFLEFCLLSFCYCKEEVAAKVGVAVATRSSRVLGQGGEWQRPLTYPLCSKDIPLVGEQIHDVNNS